MEINNIVFPNSLPKIDLHGLDRDSARVLINDFIYDNIKMGNEFIVIVHGIGMGIIRNITISTLSKNKNVVDFKSDYSNRGCIIVKLKISS